MTTGLFITLVLVMALLVGLALLRNGAGDGKTLRRRWAVVVGFVVVYVAQRSEILNGILPPVFVMLNMVQFEHVPWIFG